MQANMPESAPRAEKSIGFPCPACGGKMTFDPKLQMLRCQHCDHTMAIDAVQNSLAAHDFKSAPRQHAAADLERKERTIKCESCGAQSVIDEHTTATFCPFCGAPHVVEDQTIGGITPETLLPFAIDEKAATDSFRKWVSSRRMAPRALKQNAVMGKLTGVYLPHWAFDAGTYSIYRGEAGHHYYVTEHYYEEENGKRVEKTREVQKTRWVPASGSVSKDFSDVTVPASTHVNQNLLREIGPFDLGKRLDYKPEFVSGFLSEKADVDIDKGWDCAKDDIDKRIERLCREDILSYADEARVAHVSTRYEDIAYKHFLLPVWLSSYKFKGKLYQFLINGESGKVKGESPLSKVKVGIIILIAALAILALFLLLSDDGEAAAQTCALAAPLMALI